MEISARADRFCWFQGEKARAKFILITNHFRAGDIRMKHLHLPCSFIMALALALSAQTWTDITTSLTSTLSTANPGNCGAVGVDRLTGDLIIGVCAHGVWKSTNQGQTWKCLDSVDFGGGRFEYSWGLSIDQNNPKRIAGFAIYGGCAWTLDGLKWTAMTKGHLDFGSVDWSAPLPKTMIATEHESNGHVWSSTDGGVTWKQLSIAVAATGPGATAIAMLGVMDANTFIYSNGGGIFRSTDLGATWTKVSNVNPQSRTPTLFNGVNYLGTASGLLVSKDKGATWQSQGQSINIWRGPFFGADENSMVMQGNQAMYKSADKGASWTKIADFPPGGQWGFSFDHYGGEAWDPTNNILYSLSTFTPVYKYVMPATSVNHTIRPNTFADNASMNGRIYRVNGDRLQLPRTSTRRVMAVDAYDLNGKSIACSAVGIDGIVNVAQSKSARQTVIVRERVTS
jgi:hypothetical protein